MRKKKIFYPKPEISMKRTRITKIFFFIVFFCCLGLPIQAQNAGQTDLSNVQVDQMTDEQIETYLKRAEETGMTEQQLEQAALARGMQPSEITKLRARIQKLQQNKETKSDSEKLRSRMRNYKSPDEEQSEKLTNRDKQSTEEEIDIFAEEDVIKPKPLFGFSLFNNKKISFEPSLNIPTPKNYQVGPGDELIIDIWGASQQTYKETVSPEGHIIISNLGPIYLSGMTIEEATAKIKKELGNIYAGLRSGNTFIKVSIANVRSIKVNMVGEISNPGTYTLPSLATVFNALYAAGGPSENGSLRNIRVIRDNKTVAELDIYEYLLKGEQKGNVRLQDQDVVFISPYSSRVEISGEVKRPAIYDMKPTETLKDLIYFSGGYTGKAYSQQIKIIRKTTRENKVVDITLAQMDTFHMANGDEVSVDSILNRYENRVEIKGAVFRPGIFSLTDSLTLKELLKKAEGLRGDAFKSRAVIYRTKEDLTLEVIPVDISALINNTSPDLKLQREDIVVIPSIFDMKEEYSVQIDGEVRRPGTFTFVENTTVEDLILQAGGLMESASLARIEVARRIKNNMAESTGNQIAEIFQFQISQDLKLNSSAANFTLHPFDQVFVRRSPGYEVQALVKVDGEVIFPGNYSIANKTERVSDLVKRAGGLTPEAYIKGARLERKLPVDEQMRAKAIMRLKEQFKDSASVEFLNEEMSTIGINLDKILANPQSSYDLFLEEGDILHVPKELQTVRLNGEVLHPVIVRYKSGRGLRGYISSAGGFSPEAKKNKTYVIYANGSVERTRNFIFINFYPKPEPGAEIIVPRKPEKKKMSTAEVVSIGSMVASMGLVIVTVINSIKW